MNARLAELIQASTQGDTRAFGKIVEQYQGAVTGVAYSVTGDLVQSEDVAQEAFVIAWKKLGTLRKHESLVAWLCGIARNLARDWLRKQSKAPTVPLDSVAEPAVNDDDAPSHLFQERAEAVWAALAGIAEIYREPLILFYRQGHSVRDIAEALDLTEDCVKQRLSRGRAMLRAEVARMVEDTLEQTRPGKSFTAGVLAALPVLTAPQPGTPVGVHGASAKLITHLLTAKTVLVLGSVLLLLAAGVVWRPWERPAQEDGNGVPAAAPRTETTSLPAKEPSQDPVEPTANAVSPEPASSTAASQSGLTVSGVVVFRDTQEPADATRVLLAAADGTRHAAVTDAAGRFRIAGVPAGECALVAYDARYEDVPEDWLRSDHVGLDLSDGQSRDDVRIEVPARGGKLVGHITDKKTGEPVSGITVAAFHTGTPDYTGTSDAAGEYTVIGLGEGEWTARISRFAPFFSSDSINTMHTILMQGDGTAHLDMALDRGRPISGRVVGQGGEPVPNAYIDGELFLPDQNRMSCSFKTSEDGTFTVWGATPGSRAVLSARKTGLGGSAIAVVDPVPNDAVQGIVLTIRPLVRVTGRFVDANGRSVEAQFWRRPVALEGAGNWLGQGADPAGTFEILLAQGDYEVKGLPAGNDFGIEQPVQSLHVGSSPVTNLTIPIMIENELAGPYELHGTVLDEQEKPLSRTRVYISGRSGANQRSFQETYTNAQGHFAFAGLKDADYEVKATPGQPFESFPGIPSVNPADTAEVKIVARRAAMVRGRVVDAETGAAVRNFRLLYGERFEDGRMTGENRKAIASDDGVFTLPMTLDSNWYLCVAADGHVTNTQTGKALSAGESTDELVFRLTPHPVIHGAIVDEAGAPVPAVGLFSDDRALMPGFQFFRQADATSDTSGVFALQSFPEGAPVLYAVKKGYAVAFSPIRDGMRMVMTRGGVIEGHVLTTGGAPVADAKVLAQTSVNARSVYCSTAADAAGYYRFDQLMDGAYHLSGRGPDAKDYSPAPDVVEAANGIVVTYDLVVPDAPASK